MKITSTASPVWVTLVGGLAAAGPAAGQEIALLIPGNDNDLLGRSLFGMPDMNGDGVPDLIAGGTVAQVQRGGFVALYSGADGSVLQGPHYAGLGEGFGLGASRAGDFDGDGVEDYMAGNTQWDQPVYQSGEVRVFSGKTGKFIARLEALHTTQDRLGDRQIPVGDIDLDGYDDVLAVPQSDDYVAIYGGPDGHLIRVHDPSPSLSTFAHVARLDDLNGDGVTEYAIGSPGWNTPTWDIGKVEVFDGLTGSMLYRVGGLYAYAFFGSIAPLSDIDGDGIGDWAAGASETADQLSPLCGGAGVGTITFHSGVDGRVLRRIAAPTGTDEAFGWQLRGGGDVNGDGVWDLLVASPCYWARLRVYSGRTGTHLWSLTVGELEDIGYKLSPLSAQILEDLDGDGCAEWGMGAGDVDWWNKTNGAIIVFAGAPGDAETICAASPNGVGPGAELETFGSISVGDDELELWVHGAPPGRRAQFVYGPEGASRPFGDGVLCIAEGPRGAQPLAPPQVIEPDGTVELKVPFDHLSSGPGAWLAGATWVVQLLYHDPGGPLGTGINASSALRVTLNP